MQVVREAQRGVSFVGKLTKLQYKSGQAGAQLVFKSASGTRLAVCRNLHTLQSLRVGNTYRVEGFERDLGSKSYIRGPHITPASFIERLPLRRKRALYGSVISISLMGALVGSNYVYANYLKVDYAAAQSGTSQTKQTEGAQATAGAQTTVDTDSTTANPDTTTTAPSQDTTAKPAVQRSVVNNTPTTPPINTPVLPAPQTPLPVVTPDPSPPSDPAPTDPTPDPDPDTPPEDPPVEQP